MSKELVNYEEQLAQMANVAARVERPATASIGTRAGILTYAGTPVAGNKLDVIVIASSHANAYYEGKYDPDSPATPVCYAYSQTEMDLAPHPSVENPQADNCATCPKNQWGSAMRDGVRAKGKACKNSRKLALIPAGTKPEEIEKAEIAILTLPVTSVPNWSQYVNKVASLTQRPPLGVFTTIGTVPDVKSQFKVTFAMGEKVGVDMLAGLFERAPKEETSLAKVYEPREKDEPPSTSKKF